MSNPIPSQLGLITIEDDSEIVASDHRNNYSDIQTAVNDNIIALTSGEYSGSLLYAPDSSHLAFLPDAPSDGDALIWNAAASRWEPGSVGGGGGGSGTTYRKTTTKTVNDTVSETDLFNGEFTVAANVLGTSGLARITAEGDCLNNNALTTLPRFKLKLGSTMIFDTGAGAANSWANGSARYGWTLEAIIRNLGGAGSQSARISFEITSKSGGNAFTADLTTGEGKYFANLNGGDSQWAKAVGFNTASVDTTSSQVLAFTVVLPAASTNVEAKLYGAIVEIV